MRRQAFDETLNLEASLQNDLVVWPLGDKFNVFASTFEKILIDFVWLYRDRDIIRFLVPCGEFNRFIFCLDNEHFVYHSVEPHLQPRFVLGHVLNRIRANSARPPRTEIFRQIHTLNPTKHVLNLYGSAAPMNYANFNPISDSPSRRWMEKSVRFHFDLQSGPIVSQPFNQLYQRPCRSSQRSESGHNQETELNPCIGRPRLHLCSDSNVEFSIRQNTVEYATDQSSREVQMIIVQSTYKDRNPQRNAELATAGRLTVSAGHQIIDVPGDEPPNIKVLLAKAQAVAMNDIVCISNTDISFEDPSVSFCEQVGFRQCFALSRRDANGQLQPCSDRSQDAWVFRGPPPLVEANFPLGKWGCDNRFATLLIEAGWSLFNPSRSIKINHHHASPREGTWRGAVNDGFGYTTNLIPCTIEEFRSGQMPISGPNPYFHIDGLTRDELAKHRTARL